MENKTIIREIKTFEETCFNELDHDNNENGHCLIFRCGSKNSCKMCYESFQNWHKSRWKGDILTISKEDYKKLIEKSTKLEIIDSLET